MSLYPFLDKTNYLKLLTVRYGAKLAKQIFKLYPSEKPVISDDLSSYFTSVEVNPSMLVLHHPTHTLTAMSQAGVGYYVLIEDYHE